MDVHELWREASREIAAMQEAKAATTVSVALDLFWPGPQAAGTSLARGGLRSQQIPCGVSCLGGVAEDAAGGASSGHSGAEPTRHVRGVGGQGARAPIMVRLPG